MEIERLTLSVAEAARVLGISRNTAYELVRQDQIPYIRFGKRILIPRKRLIAMLEGDEENSGYCTIISS